MSSPTMVPPTLQGEIQANETRSSLFLAALLGAMVGLAAYFALGFNHVLAPHDIGWIFFYTKDFWYWDPAAHFLGWHYFRHEPWSLMVGRNHSYGMEMGASIVFSDSEPIMAFIFKPFSRWLGPVFQYEGIWILSCFLLQGTFAGLLAAKVTRRFVARILLVAFFALAPIMLERAWTEYTLMAHWLILWALWLCLSQRKRPVRWVWLVLAFLAVTIHFYFEVMVLALWTADVFRARLQGTTSFRAMATEGLAIAATVAVSMWACGYFLIPPVNAGSLGYGNLATNVLAPIDPGQWSTFMQPQPKAPHSTGEGYGYLGFGMILMCGIAMFELARAFVPRRKWLSILPLILVLLGLTAFAVSNKISLGSFVFEVKLRQSILHYAGALRASSRILWPAYYGLWLAIFWLVMRSLRTWRAELLLLIMLAIQVIDLSPLFLSLRERYVTPQTWESPLKDPFWAMAVQKYHVIAVVPSGWQPIPYVPLAYLGASNGLPTNACYLARYPSDAMFGKITAARDLELRQNHLDRNLFYVVDPDRFRKISSQLSKEHGIGWIDGYCVIAPYWFESGKPVCESGLKPGGTIMVVPDLPSHP